MSEFWQLLPKSRRWLFVALEKACMFTTTAGLRLCIIINCQFCHEIKSFSIESDVTSRDNWQFVIEIRYVIATVLSMLVTVPCLSKSLDLHKRTRHLLELTCCSAMCLSQSDTKFFDVCKWYNNLTRPTLGSPNVSLMFSCVCITCLGSSFQRNGCFQKFYLRYLLKLRLNCTNFEVWIVCLVRELTKNTPLSVARECRWIFKDQN